MTIELTSRARIPHERLSLEWIEEYLSRRGMTPASFVEKSSVMSQNQLSSLYKIQKKDVGAILRILGVDTQAQRSKKQSSAASEASAKRLSRLQKDLDPIVDKVADHIRIYGWKDAGEKFGKRTVNDFSKLYPDFLADHASKTLHRKHLREVENSWSEVVELLEESRTVRSIARELDLPLSALVKKVDEHSPGYKGCPTEEEKTANQLAVKEGMKKAKDLRYAKTLGSVQNMDAEELRSHFTRDLALSHRVAKDLGVTEEDLSAICSEKGIDTSLASRSNEHYRLLRLFAAKGVGAEHFNSEVLKSKQARSLLLPFFAEGREDLYRLIALSIDREYLQSLVDSRKLRFGVELWRLFSFWHFQSYLSHLESFGIEFYQENLEEYVCRMSAELSVSAEEIKDLIVQTLPTDNYIKAARGIGIEPKFFRMLAESYEPGLNLKSFSRPEEIFAEILEELSVDYEVGNRTVLGGGREIDFYLKELNLGFEINPIHSHNSTRGYQLRGAPKSPDYHLKKSRAARDAGISLVHIYDDLLSNPARLKAFVSLKIQGPSRIFYGRSVRLSRLEKSTERKSAIELIREHHRQGLKSAKEYYGFYSKDGELLGAASFSPSRAHGSDWELVRLCFCEGVQIRFGIAKLLARFAEDFPRAKRLLTYSNLDYGYSDSYEKAGFQLLGETGPSLSWVNPDYPEDSYSWSVATPWSAKRGVIAEKLGPRDASTSEAEAILETELPRRRGSGKGYCRLYRSGSKILTADLGSIRNRG